MQFKSAANTGNSVESSNGFSLRQKMISGSVGLAVASSFSVPIALAHVEAPNLVPSFTPHNVSHAGTNAAVPTSSAWSGGTSSALSFSTSHVLHQSLTNAVSAAAASSSASGWHTAAHLHNIAAGRSALKSAALTATTPSSNDLELNSGAAIYKAGSLAGFNTLTIDIGGKQQTVTVDSKLTAAELVAVQQVISTGAQDIKINATGVATGGYLVLNASTVSALTNALGGSIGTLDIAHGVKAVDSLANLQLGSLDNYGSLVLTGSAGGAKTSTIVDTITAANIVNEHGGVISNSVVKNTVSDIALDATSTFDNSGKIVSRGNLNISAPTINNSGLLNASTGSVNLTGSGTGASAGDITVNGSGGTIQASQGNINFNDAAFAGVSNINVAGGNLLSQQVNFNAGTGAVQAQLGTVTGAVNGTASDAHVTAGTGNLQLGNLNVSGDPTYYNTAGSITVTGDLTGSPDLALIASGNIIGNGGSLNTSGATGGNLTLIAGANFAAGTPASDGTTPDTTTTITLLDSTTSGKGSATGGYIDLSGITLTGSKTNIFTPVNTNGTGNGGNGGNILMVAYKGTASSSGSIVATATAVQDPGAVLDTSSVSGTAGSVTLIGGGAQITAQNIIGSNINILAGTPTLSGAGGTGSMTIKDGSILTGSYSIAAAPSATAVNVTNLSATQNLSISTAGKLTVATGGTLTSGSSNTIALTFGSTNGTAAAPIQIGGAGILSVNGTASTSSAYLNYTGGAPALNLQSSTLGTSGTFSLTSATDIAVEGTITAATIIISTTGSIQGSGVLTANTATLNSGNSIVVNTAVNTLTANSTGNVVFVTEASTGKALSLLTSSSGNAFTLISAQPINVNGVITAPGDIELSESGSTNAVGINITKALGTPNLTLITSGTDAIKSSVVLNPTGNLTIFSGGAVGASAAPLQTKVGGILTIDGNSLLPIYIKDTNTVTSTITGQASTPGELISISSVAANLNIGPLTYSSVTISDTATYNKVAAVVNINPGVGGVVGDGTGIVKITASGSITQGASNGIDGTNVTLISTTGSIGSAGTAVSVGGTGVNGAIVTASAVKGLVNLDAVDNISLDTGSALSSYTVTGGGGSAINVNGTITATTKTTGIVSIDAQAITQGLSTAFLTGANVLLTTGVGGQIGVSTGFQSIQTKASTSLVVSGGVNSSSFVTQNGTLTLLASSDMTGGSNASLNLSVAKGDKLTIEDSINYANLTVNAPTSLIVSSGGSLISSNLTVNTPLVTVNTGGVIDASSGIATFASTAALTINGAGSILLGSGLTLSGLTNITLGNSSGGNNPLAAASLNTSLNNLTIFTKGVFAGAYSSFETAGTANSESLSITASNLKNTGTYNGNPIMLVGNGLQTNSVTLDLTGIQNVTLGTTTVNSGQQNYDLVQKGSQGGTLSVTATGILTVNTAGINITPTSGNTIVLAGKNLKTQGLLDPNYFDSGLFTSVSLLAGSGTFYLGATGTQLNNGIAGTVSANTVNIAAPTAIVVTAGQTITGNQLTFNTANFQLSPTSAVAGTTPNNVAATLTVSNVATGNLTISGTGSYSNIGSVVLQSTTGGVNTGTLFTAANLLGNGSVNNIALSANGSVVLTNTISTLSVADGGQIFINASALSYSASTKNPQTFLTLQATSGQVDVSLNSAITLGKSRGYLDISVGAAGGYSISSGGVVTVNEALTTSDAALAGTYIYVNSNTTATNSMSISALNAIQGTGVMTAGALTIGQGRSVLTGYFANISTGNLTVVNGALALKNNFGGNVTVGGTLSAAPLEALDLVNTSNNSATTLTVNSIVTAAGSIDIVNNNGGIKVSDGALLQTTVGSIYLQDTDIANGTITIGQNVSLLGSGKTIGSGQVDIVIGAVPLSGTFAVGTQPSPIAPIATSSGGAHIYYSTTANPNGSITSNGINQLDAAGRNIIFNSNGNSSAITLEGGDVIVADPPVVAVSAAASAPVVALTASPVTSISASSLSANAAAASAGGNALATTFSGLSNLNSTNQMMTTAVGSNTDELDVIECGDGKDSDNKSDANHVGSISGEQARIGKVSLAALQTTKGNVLSGGVSNNDLKALTHGAQLYAPKENTSVQTAFGSVEIAAGSVVLLMANDGLLAIYNLHDTRDGAIAATVGGRKLTVMPGQDAVLTTKKVACFENINPASKVAYRKVVSKNWGEGVQGFHSEFSVASLLHSVEGLREMLQSQDSDVRKMFNRVLKTSAILTQFGGEQYEYIEGPALTAMNAAK